MATDRRDISTNRTTGHSNYLLSDMALVMRGTHARLTWNRFKIWSSIVTSFPWRRVDFKVGHVTCASNLPAADP